MISFIHRHNDSWASYRYRAQIPARELGAPINDFSADVLIFTKPQPEDVKLLPKLRADQAVIVDVCDDWIGKDFYQDLLARATAISCSTNELYSRLGCWQVKGVVIHDPYEFEEAKPHCAGARLLWFGHAVNYHSVQRSAQEFAGFHLRIVSNVQGAVQWSRENLLSEMAAADIVVMPETLSYKSCNRTVEAIRRGCFVVAENHVALREIPGIWIGGLREGIEWAYAHQEEANEWTQVAQKYVLKKYSPSTVSNAWKSLCEKVKPGCISAAGKNTGTDG